MVETKEQFYRIIRMYRKITEQPKSKVFYKTSHIGEKGSGAKMEERRPKVIGVRMERVIYQK